MTALVLSGSYTETNRFAQQHGLGYGIRHVVSASNLDGRRPTSIHILPSYYDRRDIHAVNAAMKHVERRVKHIPVLEYDFEDGVYTLKVATATDPAGATPSPTPAPDESKDAVPGQISIEEAIADDDGMSLSVLVVEPITAETIEAGDITSVEVFAPAPEPVATGEDLPEWMQ